ncbi:MAG: acyl-CoA thioesterase [Candidatus Dormibacteraeota bacterium]|nr:acyl-CoA thioesterase [Candidatus Dormibacteraeota bacterium]
MSHESGGRRVRDSQVTMSVQMNPGDANPSGDVHGGTIMKLVDTAAGVCAVRHCRSRVVTATVDSMTFLHPVHVGDLVTCRASVNDVGSSSLEIGVRVDSENVRTGEAHHTSSAYLVFVALDDARRPTGVPPLVVETEDERRRQQHARIRRESRQKRTELIKRHMDPGLPPDQA